MNKKIIEVVAAVIISNDKYFVAQRANKGELALKWEFPGGKIEQDETPENALIRELKEELNINIQVNDYITTVFHEYNSFYLKMHAYYAEIIDGSIFLNEHLDFKWVNRSQILNLDLAAADIPIARLIK
jgi:8-oxo-dGTP diphosphatase